MTKSSHFCSPAKHLEPSRCLGQQQAWPLHAEWCCTDITGRGAASGHPKHSSDTVCLFVLLLGRKTLIYWCTGVALGRAGIHYSTENKTCQTQIFCCRFTSKNGRRIRIGGPKRRDSDSDMCAAQIHRETLVGKASSSWKGWVHQPRLSCDTNACYIQTLVGG